MKYDVFIIDSFSELTYKLFINKENGCSFLAHYREINRTSIFENKYICEGLLPIDKLENFYTDFFLYLIKFMEISLLFLLTFQLIWIQKMNIKQEVE